jgi:hypothetical protein
MHRGGQVAAIVLATTTVALFGAAGPASARTASARLPVAATGVGSARGAAHPTPGGFPGNSSYTIRNSASGHCLDQEYTNGVPQRTVVANPCKPGASQQWIFIPAYFGFGFLRNSASSDCLVQDDTDTPGHGLHLEPCTGGPNGAWGSQAFVTYGESGEIDNIFSHWSIDQVHDQGQPSREIVANPPNRSDQQSWYLR